jgi:uncharacterized protein (DUF488 family)
MSPENQGGANPVLTIGHSTRTLEDFLGILTTYGVYRLVDIRTVPRSRKNPQFNMETLPAELIKVHIEYLHMAGLGGLRHSKSDSINTGWRNLSFRGFADYMQTPEFTQNLEELLHLARVEEITLMCAEAVPWRCHRSLISDSITLRGIRVEHILSSTSHYPHKITPWARVDGMNITYPPEEIKSSNG